MAIKDGFIKTKKRRKLTDGDYKAVSQWTSASTVEMSDGQTVQKKIHDDIELHDISETLDFANYNSESGQLDLGRYNNKNGSPMTQKEFAQRVSSSNHAIATAVNTGNSADKTVTFTSDDSTDTPTSTPPALITSGETHASLFNKISTAVKNVRWLLSKMGTTDLSGIGDGTVTNAISTLNSNIIKIKTKQYEAKSGSEKLASQIYEAQIDLTADKPNGTVIAIIATPSIFNGYGTAGIFASIYGQTLYMGCLNPNWDMIVTVTWLYI